MLHALCAFQAHVADSFRGPRANAAVPHEPDEAGRAYVEAQLEAPVVLVDEVEGHPGGQRRVEPPREWLHVWEPEVRRRQVWYERERLKDGDGRLAEQTRPNSLFLSAAAQHNHPDLLPVYSFVTQRIHDTSSPMPYGYPVFPADHPILSEAFRPRLLAFLRAADLGVDGVSVIPERARRVPLGPFPPEHAEALAAAFEAKGPMARIELIRGVREGAWQLHSHAESRGTWALIARLADLAELPPDGGVLIIDEIDGSLHPDLCRAFVELFVGDGGRHQLLFTTHDRGLLEALRTDEVVIVEKLDHATTLTPASDYRGLRARDDLLRAHKAGRMGGVPILGDLAGAVWTEG